MPDGARKDWPDITFEAGPDGMGVAVEQKGLQEWMMGLTGVMDVSDALSQIRIGTANSEGRSNQTPQSTTGRFSASVPC